MLSSLTHFVPVRALYGVRPCSCHHFLKRISLPSASVACPKFFYSVSWKQSDMSTAHQSHSPHEVQEPTESKNSEVVYHGESGESWEVAPIAGPPKGEETKIGGPQHILKTKSGVSM